MRLARKMSVALSRLRPGVAAALVSVAAGGVAPAFTISEPFAYPNGTDFQGQTGGTNWASAWTSDPDGSFLVTNLGLSYAGVASSGGSAIVTPGNTTASSIILRDFGLSFSGNDTFYVGFIARKTVADDNTRYFGVALYSNNTELVLMGQGSGFPNWTINHVSVGPGTNTLISGTSSQTESYLLAKFQLNSLGLETVTFWVNPDLSMTEAAALTTAVGGTSYQTDIQLNIVNRIRIGGGGTNATQGVSPHWLDEIMITTDSPFAIPEPSVIALLAAAGAFFGARALRRRA